MYERSIFVYGTLQRGEPNHGLIARRALFLGEGLTEPVFQLRNLGAFPGLVFGGTSAVSGEVYAVDTSTLAAIDALEGHPTFYRRIPIVLSNGALVETYLLRPEQVIGCTLVKSGVWRPEPRFACTIPSATRLRLVGGSP